MIKHHSEDYKISVIKYYLNNNVSLRDACKIFGCSYKSLYRWVNKYKKKGCVKRKKTIKKSYKITKPIEKYVVSYVKKNVNITLWELSKLVEEKYKVKLSDGSIFNILKKNKITRKRLRSKYYPEKREGQEKEDLKEFYKKLKKHNYKKTISIDETSIYLNMTLPYGRSKSGTRAVKKTNKYPFKKYNLLVAISYNKIIGWTLYEKLKGGVKKEQLIEFYEKYINKKYKNYLILMDNARPHKSLLLQKLIKDSENKLLYTVSYHPETNPIEEFFSQLKHYIRKASPQDYKEISKNIKSIIKNKMRKQHLKNYFKHSFRIYN